MIGRMRAETRVVLWLLPVLLVAALGLPMAGALHIDWWTVDGGGDMRCRGGDFELSATIGQPEAGTPMTGGGFELTGGFGPVAAPPQWCLGDMNCSGGVPEFTDINYFVAAIGCESCWWQYYRDNHGGEDPPCYWLMGDYSSPRDGVGFSDIMPFSNSIGQSCTRYNP